MTRLLAVLALIAGFVLAAPVALERGDVAGFSAAVDAVHLPGTAATRATTHPVQQGHQGQPLDGVQPAVHVAPEPRRFADVVEPVQLGAERAVRDLLGERAPPLTSGF
ncbi:hypothetical protein [Saccharothrix sp.]|uniref:hypothetical protein n=1 Tax=Saccharothrix sp. TaxID=1873460 RepID=UPI002810DA09|nr:hypothetical protein [Saccharothrix sp.]